MTTSDLKKVVYKYDVPLQPGPQVIECPTEMEIIHIACQRPDAVTFWAEVYLHNGVPRGTKKESFAVIPTGGEVPLFYKHVGSVLLSQGTFVFHLYRLDQ